MITQHKQKIGTVGANPRVRPFILFLLLFLVAGQAWSGQGYESLLRTMQARQARIEQLLKSSNHCLGEGLDGLLTINASCSDEARMLAQDENQDRQELHRLMATDPKMKGKSAKDIGEERAKRYVDQYIKGVLRKVRISALETTWWDGHPPDLRKTAVSRVLALRSAHVLYEHPNADSPVVRDNVQQYEAFGVIDSTEDSTGERWYQVTEEYVPKIKPRNWSANPLGWIAENKVIPWRRAVVMRFTNLLYREPSLFFATPEPVIDLMKESDAVRKRALSTLQNQLASGQKGASGVVAVEPQVGAGQERIIMYPILDFKNNLYIGEYKKFARLLQVAARTRNSASRSKNSAVAIDIIFVMDTTNSMKPYLENVLAATEEFARVHRDDALRFGFIGYQDKDSRFSYITKEFTSHTLPASEFVDKLAQVKARPYPVRGDDIPEAVFEGVNTALDSDQWRQNAIKIIFLVGDAPGREEERVDKRRILRDKARTRNIRLFAFHLNNSSISKNWDRKSRKQYIELSSVSEGIKGTAQVQSYLRSIDAGATQFRQLIADRFKESLESIDDFLKSRRTGQPLPMAKPGSLKELIFQQATLMYADNTLPEEDITGWVCDKVLTNPDREALTPMILLTKNELEELTARVRELKKIGEKSLRGEGGTTQDFFELVTQHSKFTMVDPTAVTFRNAFSVPLGIDKLPYKSEIMNATRSDFQFPDRVQRFVTSMENKIMHYEDLMRKRGDENVWKKLSAGAPDRDRVVGVELDQLP